MSEQGPPSIEPLGSHHDRAAFSCGEPALDAYLHGQAGQDTRRGISRVFVATFEDPAEIAGFYTLSACTVEARNLPDKLARKLPKHPLPAALIGRLAVDLRYQAQGSREVSSRGRSHAGHVGKRFHRHLRGRC
jgi:hypothetical protein